MRLLWCRVVEPLFWFFTISLFVMWLFLNEKFVYALARVRYRNWHKRFRKVPVAARAGVDIIRLRSKHTIQLGPGPQAHPLPQRPETTVRDEDWDTHFDLLKRFGWTCVEDFAGKEMSFGMMDYYLGFTPLRYSDQINGLVKWLADHTTDRVIFYPNWNKIFFYSETDAVMFRLTHDFSEFR